MMTLVILMAWVVCGVIATGAFLADTQSICPGQARKYYREDLGMACFYGLFGPMGLLMAIFATGFFEHGLQYRRKK